VSAEAFVKPVTDYRALRKQVKEQRRSRRTLKYPICLDVSLLDELEDLNEQLRQEHVNAIGEADDKPPADGRAGGLTTEGRIGAVEEKIADASVVAVFDIPSPEMQAARAADWVDGQYDEKTAAVRGAAVIASARKTIYDSFSHWLDHDGHPIPADQFGLEDLKEIVEDWPQGMTFALSADITTRSTEGVDLPFSVQRSLLHPTSGETSR
jgi:hypothetical protein